MSLKFSIDGLEIEELCRAFYNNIFDTVDINQCISPIESVIDELFNISLPPVPNSDK